MTTKTLTPVKVVSLAGGRQDLALELSGIVVEYPDYKLWWLEPCLAYVVLVRRDWA